MHVKGGILRTKSLIVLCLVAGVATQFLPSAATATAAERHLKLTAKEEPATSHTVAVNAQVAAKRKGIDFYRQAAWRRQTWLLRPHTPTDYAERHITSLPYLNWELQRWRTRALVLKRYIAAHPWARMVDRTKAYRACIINHESRYAGIYKAQNPTSTASGAYQFLDGTWQTRLEHAKVYFHGKLKGWWRRAVLAPPETQDAVASYAIIADGGVDWTHSDCRAIGVAPA